MDNGTTEYQRTIANFLANSAYNSFNVTPLTTVLSGSQAYGLNAENSDHDYVGIHMMDTSDCLEHPDFRPRTQVIHKRFTSDLEEVPEGIKGGDISLDSFELWKFVSLYLKGSIVSYEILYLPHSSCDAGIEELLYLMQGGVTNRIGKAARGIIMHNWAKHKTNRKKTIIAYYKVMQAIHFLREGIFEYNFVKLLEYMKSSGLVVTGKHVHVLYMNPDTRKQPLSSIQLTEVSNELAALVDEVDKAGISTKLPDQVPGKTLENILQKVKEIRSISI